MGKGNYQKDYTPEEREAHNKAVSEGTKRWYESRTREQLEETSKKLSQARATYIENRTEEEKKDYSKKHSEGNLRRWSKITPEERKEFGSKVSKGNIEFRESLTEKEREEIREIHREASLRMWRRLSDQERASRTRGLRGNKRGSGYLLRQSIVFDFIEANLPSQFIHNGGQPNSVIIAGLEPDFIHKTKPLIIEYFEAWAHGWSEEEEVEKRERYGKAGYKLLVIREEDHFYPGSKQTTLVCIKEFLKE